MTTDTINGLLFVYNADSGLFNTLADIGHKMFSPETYSCQLCAITHGLLTEKAAWRAFLGSLDVPCEFLHRDELRRREPDLRIALPAVLRITEDGLHVCVDASTLRRCRDIDELKDQIQRLCLGRR